MKKASALVHKYYPDLKLDYNSMLGYAVAELAVKALQAAGPDLTREKFIAAAESLGKYQGDVMAVSITPTKHTGAESVRIYQWKGGKIVPVSAPQSITGTTR
jgi:branched-chain amino acid transport system substrate-binding protein